MVSLAVALAGGFVWSILAATDVVGNVGGDGSIRLTYANFCVDRPLDCVPVISRGPWPPGQAMLLAPFIWVGGVFGLDPATVAPVVSAGLFTLSALLVRRLTRIVSTELAALIAVTGFLSLLGVAIYATNVYAEVYALPFVLGAAIVFVDDCASARCRPVLLGALLLGAAMMRTEALVIAALFAGLLFAGGRRRESLVVGAIATSSTAAGMLLLRGDDQFSYAEIAEWYSFDRGADTWPAISRTVGSVAADPFWGFGWLIAVAVLLIFATPAEEKVVAMIVVVVTTAVAGAAFAGLIKSAPRYYLWTSVFGVVCVAQSWAALVGRARGSRARVAMGAATVVVVAALGVGAVGTVAEAIDRHERFRRPAAMDMTRWLGEELSGSDVVFYDFLRFYGAYFKAERQAAGNAGADFDYSDFYTGVPGEPGTRVPVAERAANVQIREHGRRHFFAQCPDHLVVAIGPWLRRIQTETPDIVIFASDLDPPVTDRVAEIHRWQGEQGRFEIRPVHANEEFAAFEVIECVPSVPR